jgi:transcription termination/antitermination protein NusG
MDKIKQDGAEEEQDGAEEAQGGAEKEQDESSIEPVEPEKVLNPAMKWYVVHTYSGFENRAKQSLEERIKSLKFEDMFGEILVPTEEVVEVRKGEKRTSRRKFFPGYILVHMEFTDQTWYVVKETPKVTGFVGGSPTKPSPVPEEEIKRLTSQISEGAVRPRPRIEFENGDQVRVADGPFLNFNGVVDEINMEKGKLRILISIFGRSTPVELEFSQVEKV